MKTTLIHVPHSSILIPGEHRGSFVTPFLARETGVMTDRFCDELFDCGEERLIFPVSRLVCDPERFRNDADESMARVGMGVVYTACSDLTPLRRVSPGERERLLREYCDPHHARLTSLTAERLKKYGRCLVIDAHSFHPSPLPYEPDQNSERPDFCIGTDPFHTPAPLAEALRTLLVERGYTVKLDSPYAGTIVPMAYYRRDARVSSVMIEVNRALYMDAPGVNSRRFDDIRRLLASCVRAAEEAAQAGSIYIILTPPASSRKRQGTPLRLFRARTGRSRGAGD